MSFPGIDYQKYTDLDYVAASGLQIVKNKKLYDDHHAASFDYCFEGGEGRHEVVELQTGVLLLFGQSNPPITGVARQLIKDSDWIHFQFRVDGEGYEDIGDGSIVSTTGQSCIITRYCKDAIITRENSSTPSSRTACLFFHPEKMRKFFEIPDSCFEKELRWLSDSGGWGAKAINVPIHPMAVMAINDLFSCPFYNQHRRAYMRAKAIELVSIVLHTLQVSPSHDQTKIIMNANDILCIERAYKIISTELEVSLTLAELARQVGVNRSKLAYGFKAIYGTSVQAYWRDIRLAHARELLTMEGVSVTEVAGRVGYADSSCFSRAFVKKFGVLPKYCRQAVNRI